jgi:hypothetical protein
MFRLPAVFSMLAYLMAIVVLGLLDPVPAPAPGIVPGVRLRHGLNAESCTEGQCGKRGPELGVIHSL